MTTKSSSATAPKDSLRDQLFSLIKSTQSQHGMDRPGSVRLPQGESDWSAYWPNEPRDSVIGTLQTEFPSISKETLIVSLQDSLKAILIRLNIQEGDSPVDIAGKLTKSPPAVTDEIATLRARLTSQVKRWSVFAFIQGIAIRRSMAVDLGWSTLYPQGMGPLVQAIAEVGELSSVGSMEQIVRMTQEYRCYVTFEVDGEGSFVDNETDRLAHGIVDVLNLYAARSVDRRLLYRSVSLMGDIAYADAGSMLRRTPPFRSGLEREAISHTWKSPSTQYHQIGTEDVEKWNEHGLATVMRSVIRANPEPGSAESRIQRAVMWFSRATNAITLEEQFVDLTTALESLLGAVQDSDEKPEGSISQRIADGVAGLLGGNFDTREATKKKAKHLYGIRSKVVHEGQMVAELSVRDLYGLAAKTIQEFASRETILDT